MPLCEPQCGLVLRLFRFSATTRADFYFVWHFSYPEELFYFCTLCVLKKIDFVYMSVFPVFIYVHRVPAVWRGQEERSEEGSSCPGTGCREVVRHRVGAGNRSKRASALTRWALLPVHTTWFSLCT